jgi:preprotein translocase subunit SecY
MAKASRASQPAEAAAAVEQAAGPGLATRLAVTILVPAAVLLGETITLPGIDRSDLPHGMTTTNLSIFALGVMPFVSGMMLVELFALLRPSWAALRHGGPDGRRKLGRAAAAVGVVLAAFQAYAIVRLLASTGLVELGIAADLRVGATLVAGSVFVVFLAEQCSARGLVSGLGLLVVGLPLVTSFESWWREVAHGTARPADAAVVVSAALVVFVTWYALRVPRAGSREAGRATYREPAAPDPEHGVAVPIPASGMGPILGAYTLITLPTTLGFPVRAWSRLVGDEVAFTAIAIVLVAVLGVLCSWIFNQPARVAAVMERARTRGGVRPDLYAEARAQLVPAILRTLVLLLALLAIGTVARRFSKLPLEVSWIAFGTALVLDVAAEWRARRALGDLTPVWPDHRPYAIAAAREALAAAEIPVFARGERHRTLLQFAGPFVPIDLMVPRAHAKRAAQILGDVLGAEVDSERARLEEVAKRPAKPIVARGPIVALALLAALTLAASLSSRWMQKPAPERRAVNLELVAVDDEQVLATPEDATRLGNEGFPHGITLQTESAPLGPGRTEPRYYARVVAGEGESLERAHDRFFAWCQKLAMPPGDRLATGAFEEYDETKERSVQVGWRTYLLTGPTVITAVDVVDAVPSASKSPSENASVLLQLSKDGGERFADFTGSHVRKRLAIVIDGRVVSAPVILQRIPGGRVTITMGTGDPDAMFVEAKELAARLLGQ